MNLRYTPAAIVDLEEIAGYISDVLLNPDAARGIIAGIARSCERLKEQPLLGVELRKKTGRDVEGRCLVSGQYLILYDVDDAVSILRVLDCRVDYLRVLFESDH